MNLDPVEFQCPDCGRHCVLEPKQQGGNGPHADIRIGQKVKHAVPVCTLWQRLMGPASTQETRAEYLKLATAMNRPLYDDPHVSWKEKDPDPKLFSFGGGAPVAEPQAKFTVQYVEAPEEKPS